MTSEPVGLTFGLWVARLAAQADNSPVAQLARRLLAQPHAPLDPVEFLSWATTQLDGPDLALWAAILDAWDEIIAVADVVNLPGAPDL